MAMDLCDKAMQLSNKMKYTLHATKAPNFEGKHYLDTWEFDGVWWSLQEPIGGGTAVHGCSKCFQIFFRSDSCALPTSEDQHPPKDERKTNVAKPQHATDLPDLLPSRWMILWIDSNVREKWWKIVKHGEKWENWFWSQRILASWKVSAGASACCRNSRQEAKPATNSEHIRNSLI